MAQKPTDKVRAALEKGRTAENRCLLNKYYAVMPSMEDALQPYEEALSLLEGHVIVPVGLLTEAASAVLWAREDCRNNQYWYNTYGNTLKKLEDAVWIAPYVKGSDDGQ